MAEPLRHRQTKEAATDMFSLQPTRHIPTLPLLRHGHRARQCPVFGLAAATGFRVFLPMLIVSAGAYTGHVPLGDSFAWLGTPSALTMLSVAAIVEILAYCIPGLDNLLDTGQALEAAFKPAFPTFRFPVECFFVGFTFEALLVAADSFKRAGSTNGPELMKALRETNIVDHIMIGPPIKFD